MFNKLREILANATHIYNENSPAFRIYKNPYRFLFKPVYRLYGLLIRFEKTDMNNPASSINNFIVESANQFRAMQGLQAHLDIHYSYIDLHAFRGNAGHLRYPFVIYYLILIPIHMIFLPLMCIKGLQAISVNCLIRISIIFSVILAKFSFKRAYNVTFANDHSFLLRSLAEAFFIFGKNVSYVQHGPVGKHFPPLSCYKICYLDGKNTLSIYREISNFNSDITTHLVGPVRLLSMASELQCEEKFIGVLPSLRDEPINVENSIKEIVNKTDLSIWVKLHPRDTADRYSSFVKNKLHKSDSIEIFLAQCHCVISGASGSIIDAAYLGVPVLPMIGIYDKRSPYQWVKDFPFCDNFSSVNAIEIKKSQFHYVTDRCL